MRQHNLRYPLLLATCACSFWSVVIWTQGDPGTTPGVRRASMSTKNSTVNYSNTQFEVLRAEHNSTGSPHLIHRPVVAGAPIMKQLGDAAFVAYIVRRSKFQNVSNMRSKILLDFREAHTSWIGSISDSLSGCTSCQNTVYLSITNIVYKDRFPELIHGTSKQFAAVLAMVALDQETYDYFYSRGIPTLLTPPESIVMQPTRPAHGIPLSTYSVREAIICGKIISVSALLQQNWTVVFGEMDVYWRKQPRLESRYEFLVGQHSYHPEINIGFYLARPYPNVISMFDNLVSWIVYPERTIAAECSTMDQKIMDLAVRGNVESIQLTGLCEIADKERKILLSSKMNWAYVPLEVLMHWPARGAIDKSIIEHPDLAGAHPWSGMGKAPEQLEWALKNFWRREFHDEPTKNHYDVCVVGAGLSGAVIAERYATHCNKTVLVMEKRDHIGGNCYDYVDKETGIRVNQYGAHLFHTNSQKVWDYIQQFSKWVPYEHKVLAFVDGKYVPVPVNIDTVNALFGLNIQDSHQMNAWLKSEQVLFQEPKNSEEMSLSGVGTRLYEKLFKPYTIKQWSKTPAQLGPEVMARIPVRNNHDGRYFTDRWQALPLNGYTAFFENIFAHPLIKVITKTDYFSTRKSLRCGRTYFTGPVDAYFANLGWPKLEYRSLDFVREVHDVKQYQPNSVVNHPSSSVPYTRIVEYKHFLQQNSEKTVIFKEFSKDGGEPYYPVPNPENKALFLKYKEMADREANVAFVGRLANYKYFNMDQSILNALELFENDTCDHTSFSL